MEGLVLTAGSHTSPRQEAEESAWEAGDHGRGEGEDWSPRRNRSELPSALVLLDSTRAPVLSAAALLRPADAERVEVASLTAVQSVQSADHHVWNGACRCVWLMEKEAVFTTQSDLLCLMQRTSHMGPYSVLLPIIINRKLMPLSFIKQICIQCSVQSVRNETRKRDKGLLPKVSYSDPAKGRQAGRPVGETRPSWGCGLHGAEPQDSH